MSGEWILVIVGAMLLAALFGWLQQRTRLSPEEDARALAEAERRIAEIERDQH